MILLFVSVSCRQNDTVLTDLERSFTQLPTEQGAKQRIWKEYYFEKVASSDEYLADITSLHFWENYSLIFGDRDEKVIRQFDLDLNPISQFGNGRGEGPGEFQRFFNAVYPGDSGTIWVADEDNGRITIINKETENWKTIHPTEVARHVLPMQDGHYVLDHSYAGTLAMYSPTHQKTGEFEAILRQPQNWQILMQGTYAIAPDYSIVKAMFFTNDFVRYSADGQILYFRRPIEPLPPISVRLQDNPNDIRDKPELFQIKNYTADVRINGEHVHLLMSRLLENSTEDQLNRIRDFIDVYHLETGDYMFSYRLPEPIIDFTIAGRYIAAVTEEEGALTVWKIEQNL